MCGDSRIGRPTSRARLSKGPGKEAAASMVGLAFSAPTYSDGDGLLARAFDREIVPSFPGAEARGVAL